MFGSAVSGAEWRVVTDPATDRLVLRVGVPAELDGSTMYQILRQRVDVFVVEQACAYPELDGRDLEPGARWLWAQAGDRVLGSLRLLAEPDGSVRIGRVVIAAEARSAGVGRQLMTRALELVGTGIPVLLSAQSHLEGWYGRLGFVRTGPDFVEDRIPHVPMRREPG